MNRRFEPRRRLVPVAAIFLIVALLGTALYTMAGAQPSTPRDRLAQHSQGALRIENDEATGTARLVEAGNAGALTREFAGIGDPESTARAFLSAYGALFGLTDQASQVGLREVKGDGLSQQHVRLAQREAGIPVFGADLVVHLSADGAVLAANGHTVPAAQLAAVAKSPAVAADQAAAIAIKSAGLADGLAASSQLVLFNPGLITGKPTPTYLAYQIRADSPSQPERAQWIFVNARDGSVLYSYAAAEEGRVRYTYNMQHGTNYSSATLARTETQGPVTSAPNCTATDVNNAHDYAGDTYNFYYNRFGRDSFDGAGAAIYSYVCYSTNYQNAFWDGTRMTYGNGFAAADDVVGHELSHAVTERTSNLTYSNQSGALNESFSDIFGESIDLTNGKGTDTSAVRWLMGEDIPGIGAIRNMMNPPQFGDPDSTTSSNYYCGTTDGGGVHTNSGVPNKAYALMVDGGTFNGKTITGIGIDAAAAIEYRANTYYLTSSSKFLDDYNALNRSCSDLYGATSTQCVQTKNALEAVKMNGPVCGSGGATATPVGATATRTKTPGASATPTKTNTPGPTPTRTNTPVATPTKTNTPVSPSSLVNPGFESGRGVGWAESSTHGYALVSSGITTHSGSYAAWLGGANSEVSEISQNFTVPSNGGRLYYWYRITSSDVCGYDYGYVRAGTTNLATYSLCSSTATSGYVQGSVSLTAYAGQTISLRFRSSTDSSYTSSFYIDDVSFTAGAALRDNGQPAPAGSAFGPAQRKPNAPLGPEDRR